MPATELDETTPDDELARLRAENARLRAELDEITVVPEGPRHPAGRLRAVAVFVLMAITAITFAGSVVGVWARRTVFNDQVFADRATAIGADPTVQAALGTYLTSELMTLVNPEALFQEVLPERGRILAAPLSNAVRGFVDERVRAFLASDTFAQLWAEVVAQGHTAMVRLLRGESQVISTRGDTIVINLVPVINQVLARIGQISPELFGKQIDIPTITAADIPSVAQEKISTALGKDVSPTFGVIEIQGGGDQLQAAQDAVQTFDLLVYALVILTVVLIPVTIWLSGHRRRTILQLTLALAVATVIVRRLALGLQSELLEQVASANQSAASAVARILVTPLLDATGIVLWTLAVIAAVTWLTSPYRGAVWLRGMISGVFESVTAMGGQAASQPAVGGAIAWARDRAGILQAAGVGVALLILLVTDLSWFGTLLLALVLGGYLLVLWRLPAADDAGGPTPTAPTAPA
jgi:hypothetical protein